ncbi:MAG: DUF1330 domain-containing protein [Cytophagaceae bacterium]|nr:MAG: DUF1330 domain-containing protein [Cytophagaceae bacterium]
MIYFTQLIYVNEGQEAVFHEFEDVAIPLIAKYNGQLLLRVRPSDEAYIDEQLMEKPYEIHFVSFETEQDFRAFSLDESRRHFLHLKERSVRAAILIQGVKL